MQARCPSLTWRECRVNEQPLQWAHDPPRHHRHPRPAHHRRNHPNLARNLLATEYTNVMNQTPSQLGLRDKQAGGWQGARDCPGAGTRIRSDTGDAGPTRHAGSLTPTPQVCEVATTNADAGRRTRSLLPPRTAGRRCVRPCWRAASFPGSRRRRTGLGPLAGRFLRRPTAARRAAG
jgi:hypothetical protein